jgi:hypothetical protein
MNVMMSLEDPPYFIIIQIGGNNIDNVRIGYSHMIYKKIKWSH